MPSADPTRVENHIKDILNAASTWGGSIEAGIRSAGAISQVRIESGQEILRALASNAQGGYFGSLATLVIVAHNAFLPAHDGEPGIPLIVPFSGAAAVEGTPAKPSEIDSYRADPASSIYTGSANGVRVAHDAADALGMPSPLAARYSIVNGRFKFTGLSAQVPLVQLTRVMADTGVPEVFEPTIVKLSIPKLLKEGDNLAQVVGMYAAAGLQDLAEIRKGAEFVPPVPDIVQAQRAGVV